jgi:hypothetical protein
MNYLGGGGKFLINLGVVARFFGFIEIFIVGTFFKFWGEYVIFLGIF